MIKLAYNYNFFILFPFFLSLCTSTFHPPLNNSSLHLLVGLVVKASTSRVEDPGFESHLGQNFAGSSFTSSSHLSHSVADCWGNTVDFTTSFLHSTPSTLALQRLPCQAPSVIGSALGLVGPVSVYCDWVRWKL